jgi:hypothetical protein
MKSVSGASPHAAVRSLASAGRLSENDRGSSWLMKRFATQDAWESGSCCPAGVGKVCSMSHWLERKMPAELSYYLTVKADVLPARGA